VASESGDASEIAAPSVYAAQPVRRGDAGAQPRRWRAGGHNGRPPNRTGGVMDHEISRAWKRWGRLVFAVVCASTTFALVAGNASATVEHLPNGAVVSYQPLKGARNASRFSNFVNLEFHGGPVMSSGNTDYVIFWKKKGTVYAPRYAAGVKTFWKNLAHDSGQTTNVDSIGAQYGAPYSVTFGGALTDKDPYPANGCSQATICLTDSQIREEIAKFVTAKGLPTGLGAEYFLLTPEGVESCFTATGGECSANSTSPYYCAYHSAIVTGGGARIVYSNDPYVYGKLCDEPSQHPNGTGDAALLGGMSHEHLESVTDPELNAWFNQYGEEIGDICRSNEPASEFGTVLGTAPDGSPYNQVINKKDYWYQQEWSNVGSTCKQHNP
jgi:hypothetical protein